MYYLYLDESGDLGFDFVNKKPSKFFTITILVVKGIENNRTLSRMIRKTINRKLNPQNKKKTHELKGTNTTIQIKKYFYNNVKDIEFFIYSVTLNKQRVYEQLTREKSRVYNFIARQVLDQIPVDEAKTRIELIIDKSKNKSEIKEFNEYIRRQLEGKINPKTPLDIYHWLSHENCGIQSADLFCWGIFEKYERRKFEWFNVFEKKVKYDSLYLPGKKSERAL